MRTRTPKHCPTRRVRYSQIRMRFNGTHLQVVILASVEVALVELAALYTSQYCRQRKILKGVRLDHSYET